MRRQAPGVRLVSGFTLALALGFASSGCGPSDDAPQTPAAPAAPAKEPAPSGADPGAASAKAQEIFSTRCFTCHGSQGAGDGPASAGLSPPPRNFTEPAWQDSVSDEHIQKIISFGGAAVGKSPAMPGNPDLIAQREVLLALVAHVRGLRAQ